MAMDREKITECLTTKPQYLEILLVFMDSVEEKRDFQLSVVQHTFYQLSNNEQYYSRFQKVLLMFEIQFY